MRMIAQQIFLSILFCICIHFLDGLPTHDDISCWNHTHINDYPKCHFLENQHRLLCFNGLEDEWKAKSENVQILIFCKWSKETFDPQEVLQGFTFLRELIIVDSNNLTRLTNVFSIETQNLAKIYITDTKLNTIPKDAFSNLSVLECLDLTNNALEELNITTFDIPALKYIYLAGNPLRCTKDTAWILDSSEGSTASKVADKDNLLCAAPYDKRPLVSVVEIIATLEEQCKRTVCDCELIYMVYAGTFPQKQLKAFNSVNCSHRGLTEMPSFLPANTTTLFLTGNKIKDLTPLTTSTTYKSVLDLYLDDNLIESIVVLEGSDWLDHFRLLNLRENKLTDLPTYVLGNALLHNGNVAGLYLGNNSWTCDCHFTPSFQNFLIKHPSIVKDINDIRCVLTSNNNIFNKQICDLTRTEICIPSNKDACLHPYDILSIIFASLIFLILGKLLYDYWSFTKTGKLSWISKKLC